MLLSLGGNSLWTYEQSTGRMLDDDGHLRGIGYSGAAEGKNNISMENEHNVGPIPQGTYTMDGPVDSAVHGPYAIPLIPDLDNEMFGRDHFLCHGDSLVEPGTASQGCIIMPHRTRVEMWESSDRRLLVVA